MDILGLIPEERLYHEPIRTQWWVLLPTTNQMASSPFPRPLKYPRRGAGRKGAFGVACDGASATLAPVTTTSTAARTRKRGRSRVGLGRWRTRSPCPLRALQEGQPGSLTATHGQSKPLLNGSILGMSCSSQALDKYSTSGGPRLRDDLRTAYKTGESPRERVSRRVGAGGVAGLGLGLQLVQRVGCSSWTPNLRPAPRQARRRDGISAPAAHSAAGQEPACRAIAGRPLKLIRRSPQPARLSSREHAGGLIFGLIHLRSPTFIGIQINVATQATDVNGRR